MQNELEQFDNLWKSFVTAFRGSLINLVKTDRFDFNHVKAALSEQAMGWQSDYDAEGRWINNLTAIDEEKGKLVKKILTKDIQLHELPKPSTSYGVLAIGAAGGGVVGYGVAAMANMNPVGIIAATAFTAAIGGLVGNNVSEKSKTTAINATINDYINQLDAYYHSVVATLNA